MTNEISGLLFEASFERKLLAKLMELEDVNDHGEVTGFCDSAETIDRCLVFALREAIMQSRRLRSRIELAKTKKTGED